MMPDLAPLLAATAFWSGLALMVYAFAGYPVLLRMLNLLAARHRPPPHAVLTEGPAPSISFVLVAHNEASRIASRLRNLGQSDYPGPREVILVCDGCTDATAALARGVETTIPLRLFEPRERRGKAAGLNLAAAEAAGEILVFCDARQRFAPEAARLLVDRLRRTPDAAAVSGSLEIEPSAHGPAAGIDLYWRLEKWIRHEESTFDSVIGCTGAIYAMRRDDYRPLPEDTLIDDVVQPMQALVRGRRILFEPAAVAYDPQSLETGLEKRRKVRTLTGNYQMLFRHPRWLLPWANRCWWQLISHKYLRLGGPFYLAATFAGALALAGSSPFYRLALAAQILAGLAALAGLSPLLRRARLFSIPSGFFFLQVQSARALWNFLRSRRDTNGRW